MASSKSVINVAIIGDASKLIAATGAADRATGGLLKSAAKVAVTGIAVRKGFDLINDSLAEADRRGDAIQRLTNQIGDLAEPLTETADNFAKMGASAQDMLELEAIFADLATSAGVAEPEIAKNAETLSAMALALAQVHDADPSTILEAIGKAIGGQTRGLKEYGIDLTTAAVETRALADTGKTLASSLTAQELAAARTSLIMEALTPILGQVRDGTADVNQKQDELAAKFETVSGKIGAGLEGPIGDLLTWVNDMVDAIPGAIDGWNMLGIAIDGMLRDILGPLAKGIDAARDFLGLLGDIRGANAGHDPIGDFVFGGGGNSDRNTSNANNRENERNGLHTNLGR